MTNENNFFGIARSVLSAEQINELRSAWERSYKEGDSPRPKRKRGFHRALKRNEPWAVAEKSIKEIMETISSRLFVDIYYPRPEAIGLANWLPKDGL